jgi:hypothetical protein
MRILIVIVLTILTCLFDAVNAYDWKKTWLNVCPTRKVGSQVYGTYKFNSGPYIVEDALIKVLERCMGMDSCGITNPGNEFLCTVKKPWKSAWWSGHVYVYHDTNGSYQCYSSQWKSGDYYKC